MSNGVYWVRGPWPGKLGMAARPRGGDWLQDELAKWRREGISTVVSLLMPEEEREFDLETEGRDARNQSMKFLSVPIADRQVPDSDADLLSVVQKVEAVLDAGNNVVVHCRQGIGRSGLFAACLLINRNWSPQAAVEELSAARGRSVPETLEQRKWLDQYAARSQAAHSFAGPKRKVV